MSVKTEINEMFDNMRKGVINYLIEFNSHIERQYAFLDGVEKDIEQFKKEGVLKPNFENIKSETQPETNNVKESTLSTSSSSVKENSVAPQTVQTSSKRQTRRNVLQETTVSNTSPEQGSIIGIHVKKERMSKDTDIRLKKELINMPPPTKPPVKSKNTRSRRNDDVQVKMEVLDISVIEIQKAPIDTIVIEDSFEVTQTKRVTRARTKVRMKDNENEETDKIVENAKPRTKRKRMDTQKNGSDEDKTEPKQLSKKKSSIERTVNRNSNQKNELHGENEQQIQEPKVQEKKAKKDMKKKSVETTVPNSILTSTPVLDIPPRPNLDETLLITNPTLQVDKLVLNETVVIEKPTAKQPTTLEDLMTDDEDVVNESPVRTRQGKTKQVFSPYENSPVKKRVQAFEKLGAVNTEVAGTTTRSKKMVAADVRNDSANVSSTQIPRLFGTPMRDIRHKNMQVMTASKAVTSNSQLGSYNMSLTGASKKTASALKASQLEFRERELRRKQKEAEALQKKEALILAQTEEKRRKREEREQKVLQSKLALEKDKQKHLEVAEKAKDEKLRQMLAEKEAKYFKQKEELARKRAAALKKAAEAKQQEEVNDKYHNQNIGPAYLTNKTPLLPTADCYDSDDSTSRATFVIPGWQHKTMLQGTLKVMYTMGSHRKHLFLSGPEAPNLKVIFPMIEPAKLKRTSSAIWNQTEMSILESMMED